MVILKSYDVHNLVFQGSVRTLMLPHSTLDFARPSAWTFVPPGGCVLFGLALAVAFDTLCRQGSFHLDGACLAVLRRRPWHTFFGNVLIAPATGKGYGAWFAWHRCTLSMRDGIIYEKPSAHASGSLVPHVAILFELPRSICAFTNEK